MRPGLIVLFIVCTACGVVAGQRQRIQAEIPFELRDGFIWIKVAAKESSTTLNFILDSGAVVSTLNSATAERLGLRDGQRVVVKGVGSTTFGRWPQRLDAQVRSVELPKSYLAVDLCALQASCECRIDGLIGADFFRSRIVQLDFEKSVLRILTKGPADGEVIALRKRRDVWQVPVSVNGRPKGWFRLDTGCANALRCVVTNASPANTSTKMSIALTEMTLPVTETTATLGSVTFIDVATTTHNSKIFSGEAGLVGLGLLSRYKAITLDGNAGRLIVSQ